LHVERQLISGRGAADDQPVFGPPKCHCERKIDLSEETLFLLARHKSEQAELKMANRLHYADYGLIFAQAWEHQSSKRAELGGPLSMMNINLQLERLRTLAKVKQITVHGLRHTCATLLLEEGVSVKVVQERLGHADGAMTLRVYTHVSEGQQGQAAERLSKVLYG
jgi:integrase